ncbi:hypothetical protein [Xanthobacter flavus]|uniref:hypothetical protein n=1 Tax=Xanthobacter flavus TaxID=281 RepID=UPI00372B76BF
MDDSDFRTPREKLLGLAQAAAAMSEPDRHWAVLGIERERRAYGVGTCSEMEIVEAAYGENNAADYWKAWAGDPEMTGKIGDLLEFHSDEGRRHVRHIVKRYVKLDQYLSGRECMKAIYENPNSAHLLSESAKEYILTIIPFDFSEKIQKPKKIGRPAGAGSLKRQDGPIIEQMKSGIDAGTFASVAAAARAFAPSATGYGTSQEDSVVRRLVDRYKARYGD